MRKLYFSLLFFCCLQSIFCAENPFSQYAGKPYHLYYYPLRGIFRKVYHNPPSKESLEVVKNYALQMRETAKKYDDIRWKWEADFLISTYSVEHVERDEEKHIQEIKNILAECQKQGDKIYETIVIRRLFDATKGVTRVEYAYELEKLFDEISDKEYPGKIDGIFRLACFYLEYSDYVRAEKYFSQVLSLPVNPQFQLIFIHSLNNLGLIQRDYYRNYAASDSLFKSILSFDSIYFIKEFRTEWPAIAKGNLGKNLFLQGDYIKALPLMKASFYVMLACGDHSYSYHMASLIAQSYCHTGDYARANYYIAFCKDCYAKDVYKSDGKKADLFIAQSKYFAGIGNAKLANIYLDSAFYQVRKRNQTYNLANFFYVEQKMNFLTQKIQEDKMAQINTGRKLYRSISLLMLLSSILLFIFGRAYFISYRKTQKAYKELALKAKEWASNTPDFVPIVSNNEPLAEEEKSNELWRKVLCYIELSKCYLNAKVSLDDLTRELGVNRTYLSSAINQNSDNFNTLINSYRVKEAINIMSKETEVSLEEIAIKVGFNDRKSLYRAFKTRTGVSPSYFKESLKKGL